GEALVRDALAELASRVDAAPGSVIVVNPSRADHAGVIEVVVPAGSEPPGAQIVGSFQPTGFATAVAGTKLRWVLGLIDGSEFAGHRVARVERTEGDRDVAIVFHEARTGEAGVDLNTWRNELLRLEDEHKTVFVREQRAELRRILVAVERAPGRGFAV